MSDISSKKKCAICGEVVDLNLLQCPSCGKGVFQSEKSHWHHHGSAAEIRAKRKRENENSEKGIFARLGKFISSRFAGHGYFYQPITSPAYCSDNQCPCDNTLLEEGEEYLYVSEGAVEFRQDARSESELQAKAAKYIESLDAGEDTAVILDHTMYKALLICEVAARQRGLDLDIAAADAFRAWATSEAPLRATPRN